MSPDDDRDEAFLDALTHALAEIEVVSDDEKAKRQQHAMSVLKEARREVLRQAREERKRRGPRSIPARILAMTRDAILERFREIEANFPGQLALQHRKFTDAPLEDLQSLLADAEYLIETHNSDPAGEE